MRKRDGYSLGRNKGAKVVGVSFEDAFLIILLYWPSFCLPEIGIDVWREDHIENDRRKNPGLGTSIGNGDGGAENSGTSTNILDIDTGVHNPSKDIDLSDIDNANGRANNPSISKDISDANGKEKTIENQMI